MLEILQCSPLHSLQDLGRAGYASIGLTAAGAWDMRAHHWAQWCVDNPDDSPSLELIGGGFAARFTGDCNFALTGADCAAYLDDQPVHPWQSHRARAGQGLRLGTPRTGRIAYLALGARMDLPQTLGSRSFSRREGLGIALENGKHLTGRAHSAEFRAVPRRFIPSYQGAVKLPVIQGQCWPEQANQYYQVSQASDRMGTRLIAQMPLTVASREYSAPIALGAIQVPPDGHPIILNRDHQTMGGYPVIGCMTREALSTLAQLNPGTELTFKSIPQSDARQRQQQLADFFGVFR